MAEKRRLAPCDCGSEEFQIRYTESAYQDINADLQLGDDGYNVQSRELHTDDLWCKKCNKQIKLSDADQEVVELNAE